MEVQGPPGPARAALVLFALFGAAVLADPAAPPPSRPADDAHAFSGARAAELVERIAREPHPLGSPANARVRAELIGELERIGVLYEEQPWQVARGPRDRPALEGVNLLARLPGGPGAEARPVALFVAHYDSHPDTPGAGDDGAAVAALIETLRVLQAEGPRANELWFLFTDGEEAGLLGAEAFAARPGALERLAVVLNFEGRGNGGPAILFETGRDDGRLLAEYAAAVPWPLATSLAPSVYERLPNDTDLSVFKRRGLVCLNFAWVGGGSAYHRAADTPANLDRRSLEHHGTTALALARRLGQADLEAVSAPGGGRATFFTLPGNVLVVYGGRWDPWVAALAVAAVVLALAQALRAGDLRARGLALAALGWPTFAALLAAAVFGGWWLVARGAGWLAALLGPAGAPRGNLASGTLEVLGLAAWVACLLCLAGRRLRGAWSDTLVAGAALDGCVLLVLLTWSVPGASHVLAWPLLFAALALHASLRARRARRPGGSWLLWSLALPPLALILPILKILHQVGSVHPLGGAMVGAAFSGLQGVAFLPALERVVRGSPRLALGFAGASALALTVAAALVAHGGG